MSGTVSGGQKAAQTNTIRYGADFYKRIGSIGGSTAGRPKGFAVTGKASEAGKKGGAISKRGPALPKEDEWGFLYGDEPVRVSSDWKSKLLRRFK